MEKHISVVAALHIGLSIIGIVLGFFLFFGLNLAGSITNDHQATEILSIISKVLTVFVLMVSIPGIIAGIGLIRKKEWARVLTLVLSVLDLLHFPLGTAIGIYSIWALVQPEVMEQFKKRDAYV
jgi:hypothetical protein